MRRRLNVRLLAGLTVLAGMLGAGIHTVHGVQEKRNAEALLRRADVAEKKGDTKEEETHLSRYLSLRPDDAAILARYGVSLAEHAESVSERLWALNLLESSLARSASPELLDAARRKAAELSMDPTVARFKEARAHWSELLKRSPDDALIEERIGRAIEHEARGSKTTQVVALHEQARSMFEKSIKHDPGQVEAYVRLAGLLRTTFQDAAGADRLMDTMVAGGPTPREASAQASALLARSSYRREHRLSGASDDILAALKLAKDDPEVILDAASLHAERGEFNEGRALLLRGIERDPKNARMVQDLATVEAASGRLAEAEAALRRGIEALPEKPELRALLAESLIASGRFHEARETLGWLRERRQVYQPAVDVIEGRLLVREGRLADGVAAMERGRALLASLPEFSAMTARADLELAGCYERLNNPERRLECYRRVLAVDPKSVPARAGQASMLLALGRESEALTALRTTLEDLPAAKVTIAQIVLLQTLRLPEDKRDWSAMDRALDDAAKAVPEAPELAVLRAEVLAARGKAEEGRTLLRDEVNRRPKVASLWLALAGLSGRGGRPEAALQVLEEARRALGDTAEIRLAFVSYWSQVGGPKAPAALDAIGEGLDAFSPEDRLKIEAGLGDAFLTLGEVKRAQAYWTRVAEGRPADVQPVARLLDLTTRNAPETIDPAEVGRLVARLRSLEGEEGTIWRFGEAYRLVVLGDRGEPRKFDEARLMLAEVTRRRPSWARVPLLEGQIAERQGHPERAVESYLAAIERGERSTEIVRRTVGLLNARRRFGDAERLIRRLSEGAGALPEGTLARLGADLALSRQDARGALELARRAVPQDSKDVGDQLWLAQVAWVAGRRADSGEALRRAVTLEPATQAAWAAYLDYLAKTRPEERPEALKSQNINDALKQAVAKLPPDQSAPLLTQVQLLTGKSEEAERRQLDALKARPDDPALLLETAGFYARTGKIKEVENYLGRVLAPSTKATQVQRATARRQLALITVLGGGGYPALLKALELIEKNLAEAPDSIEDRRLAALLTALQPGGGAEAVRKFEELARVLPPSPSETFLLARLHEANGEWTRARQGYVAAVTADRENRGFQLTLARSLLSHGEAEAARPWVEALQRDRADDPQVIELRARLLVAEGKGAEADRLVQEAARGNVAYLIPFAFLLEQLGRFGASEALFRENLAKSGQPDATLVLAEFLGRRGRTADALDLCDKAWAACDPARVGTTSLSVIFAGKHDETQALRVASRLEEAIKTHPSAGSLRFDLANLYSRLGRVDQAEAIYRELHELDKNADGPLNNLAWLIATAHGKSRASEALDLIGKAVALSGPIPDLLDTRGVVRIAEERADLAVKDLEASIVAAPSAEKYLHLARARLLNKDPKGAVDAWKKAEVAGLDESTVHPLDLPSYRELKETLTKR